MNPGVDSTPAAAELGLVGSYGTLFMNLRLLINAVCILLASLSIASAAPNAVQLKADITSLDKLERSFTGEFGDKFTLASKRLADQRGPEIVHAVMLRSRKWQGEEGLIFVPLVALLPRKPTLEILHQYQRSKSESERLWAGEFITEFGMSDIQEGVKKFSGKK